MTSDQPATQQNRKSMFKYTTIFLYIIILLLSLQSYAAVNNPDKEKYETIKVFSLPSTIKDNVISFASGLSIDPYKETALVQKVMGNKMNNIFPTEIKSTLHHMATAGNPSVVILKNMPVDIVIPSNASLEDRINMKTFISEYVLLGISNIMQMDLLSIPDLHDGRIIHNIAPVKGFENTQSSKGKEPLNLHIEIAINKIKPDFLILIGLEGDKTTKTSFLLMHSFFENIDQDILKEMKKPQFEFPYATKVDRPVKKIFPLIEIEQNGKMSLRLFEKMDRIKPLNQNAKNVLTYLEKKFVEARQQGLVKTISLQKGDVLIINNGWGVHAVSGVMHGRDGYISNNNRWLQRAYFFKKN